MIRAEDFELEGTGFSGALGVEIEDEAFDSDV